MRETTAAAADAADEPPVEADGDVESAPAPTPSATQPAPAETPRKAAAQPTRLPRASGADVAAAPHSSDKASGTPSLSQQQLKELVSANPNIILTEALERQRKGAAVSFRTAGGTPVVHGRAPVNPYLGGTAARAMNVSGGGQVNGLTPLSQTNTVINTIYDEPVANDAVMDEAEEPTIAPPVVSLAATLPAVTGGRAITLMEMARAARLYVTEPTARFHDQYRRKQEADRIRRATLPRNLDDNADAVAEDLANERAVVPNILEGVVRAEAHAINDVTSAEIVSLRAKVNVLKNFLSSPNLPPELKALLKPRAKKGKSKDNIKGSTTKKPATKSGAKNFQNGKKKPATSGPATQPREKAGGPGNSSNAGKRGEKKTSSHGKRAGKKASSKTGKRS